MIKHSSFIFDPWLLTPNKIIFKPKHPIIVSLGVPNDGLPAITDDVRWVSRENPRLPVQVYRAGVSEWCPGTRVERKISDELSIQLIVKGRGKLTVDKKKFDLETNDVFILHNGEHHICRALPPERFRRQVAFLLPLNSTEILKLTGLDKVSHIRLSAPKAKYVREKLEHIDLINRAKQGEFTRDIASEVFDLILILSDEVYGPIDWPDLPESMIKAMEFVLNNLNLDLNSESMAKAAFCSVGHLTRLFRDYLNTSPHCWMESQKVTHAGNILRNTRKKVYEIADELGYCDQFHFSKVFTRVMGMSPTKHRQRWRKKGKAGKR